jgi:hypothetical protein
MTQRLTVSLERFASLRRQQGWPETVRWVDLGRVLAFLPTTTFIYRPRQPGDIVGLRATFDAASVRGVPVEVAGLGCADGVTFAIVRPIEELAQGEDMFLEDNVKISLPAVPPSLVVVTSPLRWWFTLARYRRWRHYRDLTLDAAQPAVADGRDPRLRSDPRR